MIWLKRLVQCSIFRLLTFRSLASRKPGKPAARTLNSRSPNPTQLMALTLGTTLALLAVIHGLPPVQAGQSNSQSLTARFVPPQPPNQGRPPGNRRGGASRGGCPTAGLPLTALVPAEETSAQPSVWGLTTAAYPTFWFYLPYPLTSETSADFVLLDQENNYLYKTTLTRSDTSSGIIGIALPPTAKPLEVGKTYQWVFLINCEVDNPIFTRGGIQRIAPNPILTRQIQQAPPPEQATLYAANGIWFDALTTLAKLHLNRPQDQTIASEWLTLMQSVGLEDIANQPLLPCCTPE